MSIPEIVSYDKEGRIERFPIFQKLFLSLVVMLVALLSFGVGRLSVIGDREPIKIEYDPNLNIESESASVINGSKVISLPSGSSQVVVSKNGARYHYQHCSGAKQIKEKNKIVFATPVAAEAAGYTLAANCKPR